MSKLINKPILVLTDKDGRPVSFTWRKRRLPVKNILECWRYTGCWWLGEEEKTFYRVESDGERYFELCREGPPHSTSGGPSRNWKLYRIFD